MTPPRRSMTAPARRRPGATRAVTAGLTLVGLLSLSACATEAVGQEPTPGTPTGSTSQAPASAAVGIPASWTAGIDDGKERYPDIGAMGMGDARWTCPFAEAVHADGETLDSTDTTFWKLGEGLYEVECTFYPPTPVQLRFAQAEDDAARAVLEELTGPVEQRANEIRDAVTIGHRDYLLITWSSATNPAAGTTVSACYLDPETSARACLEVSDSEERSEDYDALQAAEDLSRILG